MPAPTRIARWARWALILFVACLLLAVYAPDRATAAAHRGPGFAVLHHLPRRAGGPTGLSASVTPPFMPAELDISCPLALRAFVRFSDRVLTARAPRAPPQS